jgi:exportin-5
MCPPHRWKNCPCNGQLTADTPLDLPAEKDNLKEGSRHPSLRRFCLMEASIVGPLLIFCKNAIRMHDGRCCGVVLRIFRSIVPEFQGPPSDTFPIPDNTAQEIREFISSDVLRAAIESLHDPYFVESQKDLGALIASIISHYSALTPTPSKILLSVNDIKPEDVDQAVTHLSRSSLPTRQQRAIVLDLLRDLKGVSISEQGRLSKGANAVKADRSSKKALRSKMTQEFMTPNAAPRVDGSEAVSGTGGGVRKTPDLDGVAKMFDEQ